MKNISNGFSFKNNINCLKISNNENITFNSLYDTTKAVLGEILNSLTIYITKQKKNIMNIQPNTLKSNKKRRKSILKEVINGKY